MIEQKFYYFKSKAKQFFKNGSIKQTITVSRESKNLYYTLSKNKGNFLGLSKIIYITE
jgi:hypothetical protein